MKRLILQRLCDWKQKTFKKPLLIYGARQVGKSWIMEEFGKTCFKDYVHINFEKNDRICSLFNNSLDPKVILQGLEIETHKKISSETLIVFDEIQACPQAITSLKYFCEDLPAYSVIGAGSLLGVALHEGISFPVGKIDVLHMYPMTFLEFLDAIGENGLVEILNTRKFDLIRVFKEKLIEYIKSYLYIGGMPEVVASYVTNRDFQKVRQLQKRILSGYKSDFSHHIPKEILDKVNKLWESIPVQLAKENKKFVYKEVASKTSRSKDYEAAIQWLKDSGLIYQVLRIKKPALPISGYIEENIFKLFMLDVGLLTAKTNLDVRILLEGANIFTEFKGAMTEQFVLQELMANEDIEIGYWANKNGNAEVDFIIQICSKLIPVEVKAGENLRSRSLFFYNEKYSPELCIRTSLADYKKTENLYDIPLYMIGILPSSESIRS